MEGIGNVLGGPLSSEKNNHGSEVESQAFIDGLVKVDVRTEIYKNIKLRFLTALGSLGIHTTFEAIHKIDFGFCTTRQTKFLAFQRFKKSFEKYVNSKSLAWFGGSQDEIKNIISHGFSHFNQSDNTGLYGCGIYLSPYFSHIESVKSSIADDDGVRYMLLCHVLLGRVELIRRGSMQCHPSSEEFDSGVDDLLSPKKFIVWSAYMNTHILPAYVISFRVCEKPSRNHQTFGLDFTPTPHECILYLRNKVNNIPLPRNLPIIWLDIYSGEKLPFIVSCLERRDTLHVFTFLRSTREVDGRPIINRRVGLGLWRADSLGDGVMDEQGNCVGMARNFIYVNRGSKYHRRIFMTEYTLPPGAGTSASPYDQLKNFIFCQLNMGPRRNKSRSLPNNDDVSSAPSVSVTAAEQQSNTNHVVATGENENQVPLQKPTSTLMRYLAKFLPLQTISLIEEHYREFQENKISMNELVMRIREIAGDKLFEVLGKYFREKGKILPAVEGNEQHDWFSSVPMGINVEFVSLVSECKKGVSGGNREGESRALIDGLVKLDGREEFYETIKQGFISDLGSLGIHTKLEAIHRNDFSFSFERQAKLVFFHIFSKSMEKYGNMKHAWFSASKDEIDKIISHGFGHSHQSDNAGLYGHGIYLSPDLSHIESVKSSIADVDDVRYVLLCRVLLGRVELVRPGCSDQFHPSSEEFDSGADDLQSPKKYIVWNTQMNTHILPEYVISFRIPSCLIGDQKRQVPLRKPNMVRFSTVIAALHKFLPPQPICLIKEHFREYRENKISKDEFIMRVRQIAGDGLMKRVVYSLMEK